MGELCGEVDSILMRDFSCDMFEFFVGGVVNDLIIVDTVVDVNKLF